MPMRRTWFCLLLACVLAPVAAQDATMDPRLAEAERVYRTAGPQEALPEFERLVGEFEAEGEKRSLAIAQRHIGASHWRLGNFDQSRHHLDISLAMLRDIDDQQQQGRVLNVLGLLEWDLGNFDAAKDYFQQASDIGEEVGDIRLQGATLNNISLVLDEEGDYRTSLAQYQQVLEIYSGIDFPKGVSDTLGNIGGVYLLLGQFSEARDYYEQALAISQEMESPASMSIDHGNLGYVFARSGETQRALEHYDLALEYAEQSGMQKESGQWLRGKGQAQIMAGQYDLGLQNHRAAMEVLESTGAQTALLDALHDMGHLVLMLGDPASAEQYFRQAINLARELGMPRIVTQNLLALGDLQHRHERYDDAIALYHLARDRGVESGEQGLAARAWLSLANTYQEQGEYKIALDAANQSLSVARESGTRPLEASSMYRIAEIDREQSRHEQALAGFGAALEIGEDIGDPELRWQMHYGRGLALDSLGRTSEGIEDLKQAVTLIEGVRNRLREKRYRSGYLQDKHQVYIDLVGMQMKLSRTTEAFQTAERMRTWSFMEQTGNQDAGLSEEEKKARTELRERIRQLQRNLEEERSQVQQNQRQLAIDTYSAELMLAERAFQALLDDAGGPALAAAQLPQTSIQRYLKPGEALIEYVIAEDSVTSFVLTSDGIQADTLKASQESLHSRLELLRDFIEIPESDRWQAPAKSLAGTLLQPAIDSGWLDGVEHIYLVPHGILNYLPFAVLPVGDDGQSVVERFTLSYLPTASLLAENGRSALPDEELLAMAPARARLEHAPEEVRSIGALFGDDSQLHIGESATESTFKASASDFRILHLATHGYFNKLNPLLSGLQLESSDLDDGLLEVHEILELQLAADLVTLSACKTGLGSGYFSSIPAGDDFVGMTRAFLQVGTANVLATLWEVDDRSTVDLMQSFYQNMDKQSAGENRAEALARAQRSLLGSPDYAHPYYWAPFVIVGADNHQANIKI